MFSFVNALLEKCKLYFDVSICIKWMNLFWTLFVITNFVDIFKKENKCHDHKVSAKKMIKKCVSKFLVIEFSKGLVVIIGNPNKHSFSPWNHLNKKPWCPEGHNFWKNRINHLITPAQAIGHKAPDLETYFSNSSKIRQQKMMSFWKKLTVGNLACIKTCCSFKLAKTLSMTKNISP